MENEFIPKTKEEKIGYRRPPKEHQFKAGESGNLHGRPKARRSFKSMVQKELRKKEKIKENGKTRNIAMSEILIKTLVHKATMGDTQAMDIILNLFSQSLTDFIFLQPDFTLNMGLKDLTET
jgi:hypothetical protein